MLSNKQHTYLTIMKLHDNAPLQTLRSRPASLRSSASLRGRPPSSLLSLTFLIDPVLERDLSQVAKQRIEVSTELTCAIKDIHPVSIDPTVDKAQPQGLPKLGGHGHCIVPLAI